MPSVTIYPEGCTTNGTCLIKFRRGAFASLRKVKPYFTKLWTATGIRPVHGGQIDTWAYFTLLFGQGICHFTLYEMPVFEPNEYFWKTHWDGQEEKWVAYARAMQHIMAEAGGFEVSESRMEDMLEYKNILKERRKTARGKS